MAYGNLDRKRFAYLLSQGTDEIELRKFFEECRSRLILQGAKVQNLPSGTAARIRTIVGEMPATTDEVVRAWFSKHLTMIDPEEAEAVVGVFKHYESVEEELPYESARRYARSCLVHLFSKTPQASLLDFLRTPIGGEAKESGEPENVEVSERDAESASKVMDSLPQVFIDLIEGRDADEHLSGLPPNLATFVSALQAGYAGQMDQAKIVTLAIPDGSPLRERLEQFLTKREARIGSIGPSLQGLRIAERIDFDGAFEVETDDVLGYCSNAGRDTAVFVRPFAAVKAGQPHFFSDDQRKRFFPDTGDVISFPGASQPRQPRRGEIGVWGVAEHQTDKATHFHLALEKGLVYEVRSVPFSSSEYDSVREFLKDSAERTEALLQPLLFLLGDGLIVSARNERSLSRDDAYESGLLAWTSLPAFRFEGRSFVIGPLPKEQHIYECAGLATTVRKLFKAQNAAASGITARQIRDLANSLVSTEAKVDSLRVQRVRAELEHLSEQREAFEALVLELMDNPSVKARVQELVEQKAEAQAAQKSAIQADIVRLQKERTEWEERIRKQQAENRKARDETTQIVKAAFAKARAEGVSTLADVAIFQALSAPTSVQSSSGASPFAVGPSFARPVVTAMLHADVEVIALLRSLGVSLQRAAAFAALGGAALDAGLPICISGIAARQAAERWIGAIGTVPVSIEATIGLLDDSAVKGVLAIVPRHDAIAILDANLSPLDIYARPLLDLVLSRLTDPSAGRAPACVFSLVDGVASLPVPKSFEKLSVSLDLDKPYAVQGVDALDDLVSAVTDPVGGPLYGRLWRPAADHLRIQLDALEPELKAFALSVLTSM